MFAFPRRHCAAHKKKWLFPPIFSSALVVVARIQADTIFISSVCN